MTTKYLTKSTRRQEVYGYRRGGRRGSVCGRSGAHRDIKLKIGFVNKKTPTPPSLL